MPRLTTPQELDHLVARIAATPDGIGIDGLLQALDNSLQRRTLQRGYTTMHDKRQWCTIVPKLWN